MTVQDFMQMNTLVALQKKIKSEVWASKAFGKTKKIYTKTTDLSDYWKLLLFKGDFFYDRLD